MKYLTLNGVLAPYNNDGALDHQYIRILVVYDAQTNGASPTYADVIKSVDADGKASSTTRDNFNLDNKQRFKILINKRICVPKRELVSTTTCLFGPFYMPDPEDIHLQEFRVINDCDVNYKGTDAAVGSIATGGLFLWFMAEAQNKISFKYSVRVRYTDI